MSIPLNSPGPLAFIPPVVAPIAANNIVPLAIAAAAGVGAVGAVVAGSPVVAGVALATALVAGAELLLPRPLGGDNPQGWGVNNGPERTVTQSLPDDFSGSITGTYSPTGDNFVSRSGNWVGKTSNSGAFPCTERFSPFSNSGSLIAGGIIGIDVVKEFQGNCPGTSNKIQLRALRADGTSGFLGFISGSGGWTSVEASVSISSTAPDAIPVSNNLIPETAEPWIGAPAAVQIGQQAVPAPLPLPAYPSQPATQPRVPNAEPITQPEPAQVPGSPGAPNPTITPTLPRPYAPPWITPGNPTPSDPARFPDNPTQPTQPTSPDGAIVPVPAPAPVTTPEGSVIPWPGAPPIPAIGTPPQPTMEGIATEVGRIERKLELMNNGKGNGDLTDQFQLLASLLNQLLDLLSAVGAGTTYTLDSPCEVDEEGIKLAPVEVEAPGALSQFGVLLNRFDALAELLQVHKNLKQPSCKHKVAGEIVSVNFEQIE